MPAGGIRTPESPAWGRTSPKSGILPANIPLPRGNLFLGLFSCILLGALMESEVPSVARPNAMGAPSGGRAAAAEALCRALGECSHEDAMAICSAFIEAGSSGGPALAPLLDMTVSDARWWADIAAPHELVAYGMAALDRLRETPLGLNTRKRLFVALWESFPDEDRLRFAQRIDPEGLVIRRDNER